MRAARRLRVKERAGSVLLALLVASAVGGVVWYQRLAPVDEPAAPAPPAGSDRAADTVTRGFRHVETRLDRTVWILESAEAETAEDVVRLHTVKITWYGETGTLPVIITSAEGEVNFRKRGGILAGAVRIERPDGVTLETERLQWDEPRRHLRSLHPVVITTPNFTFRGERFDANLETEQFKLHGGVVGDVRVRPGARLRPS